MELFTQRIGFGTYQNTDHEQCRQSVETALDVGYRHIDTAQLYDNESAVGAAIEASPVNRDEITIATKIWPGSLGYDAVLEAAEESLERLRVDTIDVLYVHWPAKDYDPARTLAAFEDLRRDGKIRNIGVSNFTADLLDEALSVCDEPIVANQVEFHPLLQQPDLREHCAKRDVTLVAYSPLSRGEVFDVPELATVAERHGVSEAQVSIAWLRSQNVVPIPKATSEDHIRDNFSAIDLDLTDDDIRQIESISREKRFADRDWVDW